MAASPEPTTGVWTLPGVEAHAGGQPRARVLPMRPASAKGRAVITETSGDRVGPARGIVLGLTFGLGLWAVILGLVATLFH